ncbi:nitrilase family protein [Arachidicoccus soli]|uniref:Omega-amidase YafV n=1 Tax=Arachidicoccus soli TaxID=2341117 RepID=A0A386HL26_9BACT|nr:nitrilase family protein [Arachidicoccus soli]AYD46475.1 nitrilase family protein [Arachidicoccus soli]
MSSLTITTIQSNIFWEDKAANLKMFEEKILSINEPTEVVVLPEMFTTGFIQQPEHLAETMEGSTINWMKSISSEKNIILTGSIIIKENEQYFNRLIWMLPNGQMGIYDKRHLFSFGGESEYFTSGKKRLIASVKGWKINLQICYDLRFPCWARQEVKNKEPEYDILINVANWPEKRIHHWKTLLQARAIENLSYVIGVNRVAVDGNTILYNGNTAVIDPLGNYLYEKTIAEDIFTITLKKENLQHIRDRYHFLDDADKFQIIGESQY